MADLAPLPIYACAQNGCQRLPRVDTLEGLHYHPTLPYIVWNKNLRVETPKAAK